MQAAEHELSRLRRTECGNRQNPVLPPVVGAGVQVGRRIIAATDDHPLGPKAPEVPVPPSEEFLPGRDLEVVDGDDALRRRGRWEIAQHAGDVQIRRNREPAGPHDQADKAPWLVNAGAIDEHGATLLRRQSVNDLVEDSRPPTPVSAEEKDVASHQDEVDRTVKQL
jgi:hypothetical protein